MRKILVDLDDPDSLRTRRPILAAHRGATGSGIEENSLSAIKQAAQQGYDMVELDVQETRDSQPIVFHNAALQINSGTHRNIRDLSLEEVSNIKNEAGQAYIPSLAQALHLCHSLNLGIILDVKTRENLASERFSREILRLLEKFRLIRSSIVFTSHPTVRTALTGKVRFPRIVSECRKTEIWETTLIHKQQIWFDFPENVQAQDVDRIHQAGGIIFITLKKSRFPSSPDEMLARQKIHRLLTSGIDGFLIDPNFDKFFPSIKPHLP